MISALFAMACAFILSAGVAIEYGKGGIAMACSVISILTLLLITGLDDGSER